MFGLSKKDLAIGGVTLAASLLPGGVVLAPLAGAAMSTYFSVKDGKGLDDAIQQGLVVGLVGALPGGKIAGGTLQRLAANQAGRVGRLGLQNGAQGILRSGQRWARGMPRHAPTALRGDSWGLEGTRAIGRGVGAAYMNKFYDSWTSSSPAGITELPVKMIS